MSNPARMEETPVDNVSDGSKYMQVRGRTRVSSLPIRHDVSLEAKFIFQDVVLQIRVLASIRVVDAVVRTAIGLAEDHGIELGSTHHMMEARPARTPSANGHA
jgi:hypothetical protein